MRKYPKKYPVLGPCLKISSLAFLALLGFYVFQVIEVNQKSYLVSHYKRALEEISNEVENLEFKLLEENNAKNIEEIAVSLGFEKSEKVTYIKILPPEVAKR